MHLTKTRVRSFRAVCGVTESEGHLGPATARPKSSARNRVETRVWVEIRVWGWDEGQGYS
eukprot:4596017-Pleurochrysis_carterae.AAC.1